MGTCCTCDVKSKASRLTRNSFLRRPRTESYWVSCKAWRPLQECLCTRIRYFSRCIFFKTEIVIFIQLQLADGVAHDLPTLVIRYVCINFAIVITFLLHSSVCDCPGLEPYNTCTRKPPAFQLASLPWRLWPSHSRRKLRATPPYCKTWKRWLMLRIL